MEGSGGERDRRHTDPLKRNLLLLRIEPNPPFHFNHRPQIDSAHIDCITRCSFPRRDFRGILL